MTDLYII